MRHFTPVTAVLAGLAATAGAAPAGAAPPAPPPLRDNAVFNDPRGAADRQQRIALYLRSLIGGAPAGSAVDVAVYQFADPAMADALLAAQARGVHVRVVLDHSATDPPPARGDTPGARRDTVAARFAAALNAVSPGAATICSARAACLGTGGTPIMHNKFFLFSRTSGARDVVVQSSANWTAANADRYWNNAVTLTGDAALYAGYRHYFDDLRSRRRQADHRQVITGAKATVWLFPRHDADPVLAALQQVRCTGNARGAPTRLRIVMWAFTRAAVARRLRQLAGQGCAVDVVVTEHSREVQRQLAGRVGWSVLRRPYAAHSKYLVIEGGYAGRPDRRLVFTGSHNWTGPALAENDETLLRLDHPAIVSGYAANFLAVRDSVRRSPSARPA
jgi:phosphatidylserine/phosphatidylglycerophosphate/cardiolipin synthase-like enzyme